MYEKAQARLAQDSKENIYIYIYYIDICLIVFAGALRPSRKKLKHGDRKTYIYIYISSRLKHSRLNTGIKRLKQAQALGRSAMHPDPRDPSRPPASYENAR